MKKPHETILIVDDDENDATFISRAFSKAGVANPIRWVQNGEERSPTSKAIGALPIVRKIPFPGLS